MKILIMCAGCGQDESRDGTPATCVVCLSARVAELERERTPSPPPKGPATLGRIRLPHRVRSESVLFAAGVGRSAEPNFYPFTMNPHGAVCAVLDNGELLGVKPNEFEWVEITGKLTERQIGAWLMSGKDPRPFSSVPGGR